MQKSESITRFLTVSYQEESAKIHLAQVLALKNTKDVGFEEKKYNSSDYNQNKYSILIKETCSQTENPFSDHSKLLGRKVIKEGWIRLDVENFPGVSILRRGYPISDNLIKFESLRKLIKAFGFNQNDPIILDKEGKILDGYYRFSACARTPIDPPISVYVVQLDI